MAFVKLDTKILDSSIWFENSDTKVAWITMLAMANPDGLVEATLPGISHRAGISKEATKRALEIFEGPDVNSKNPANEGKRIRRVNGGYQILNFEFYRRKDHTSAERVRRFRERLKQDVTPLQRNESPSSAPAPAVKRKQQKSDQSAFDAFWMAYPKKVGKGAAEKAWRALGPDAELIQQMTAALEWQRQQDQWRKDGGQFIPNPSTWLNQKRWLDERPAGGNGRSSLSIGAPRPEPSEPVDEVAAFLERFPEDLAPLQADFRRFYETRADAERKALIDALLALFAGNDELEAKTAHFLQNLQPKLRTPETERTYRKNYLAGKFNIPELS